MILWRLLKTKSTAAAVLFVPPWLQLSGRDRACPPSSSIILLQQRVVKRLGIGVGDETRNVILYRHEKRED